MSDPAEFGPDHGPNPTGPASRVGPTRTGGFGPGWAIWADLLQLDAAGWVPQTGSFPGLQDQVAGGSHAKGEGAQLAWWHMYTWPTKMLHASG